MNVEKLKSIVLIIFVVTSGALSWQLLSYQPEYKKVVEKNTLPSVQIQTKMETVDLIRPESILLHQGGTDLQTLDEQAISEIFYDIVELPFKNFKDVSLKYENVNLPELFHGTDSVEVVFPTQIPFSLYNTLLKNPNENLAEYRFDRVYIPLTDKSSEIYFVSLIDHKVFEASVDANTLAGFTQKYGTTNETYYSVSPVMLGPNQSQWVYVPNQETTLPIKSYFKQVLDIQSFETVLFNSPENSQKDYQLQDDTITDGTSMLTVFEETMTFSYVKPTLGDEEVEQSSKLQSDIDFVNGHAGWDPRFRYSGIDQQNAFAIFRLYDEGRAVFNQEGMSEINVGSGVDNINYYKRPYFYLDIPIDNSNTIPITLPSGNEVLDTIQLLPNFQIEKVEDMQIGYNLSIDPVQSNLITLRPAWYVRYDGYWREYKE